MLYWGSVLLKQLHNLDLTFKENWPKKKELLKVLVRNSYQISFRYKKFIQKSLKTLID